MKKIPISLLDLAVVTSGGNAGSAIKRTVQAAQHVEQLGYERIWLAEHHNMANIASSATAVLIGHIAEKTKKIRVGSGGIMLPNHAPLAVAEQFGTLATLYPERIDLGLGRAPGTDPLTANALRRNNLSASYNFPQSILELQGYFNNTDHQTKVRAFPGEGTGVPLWILGSSTDSAYLAAELGLPYAFAAHFAPAQFQAAIQIYRRYFQASAYLSRPYVLACVNVIAADTDAEAQHLATSIYQMFLGIITNQRKPLQPPIDSMDGLWDLQTQAAIAQMTGCTFIGSTDYLSTSLKMFIEDNRIDELMTSTNIYEEQARLRSLSLLSEVMG